MTKENIKNSKYQFTDDMSQISGFGGGYEQACRDMVVSGLEWWDAHPEADPKFHGYSGIYGIISEDNDDAKALSRALLEACDDCTGAMHQACMSHVVLAHGMGWEKYMEESRKRYKEKHTGKVRDKNL